MSRKKHCSPCFCIYSRRLSCPVNVYSNQKCLPRTRFASEKWNNKCYVDDTTKLRWSQGASQWLHDSWHLIFEEEAGGRGKQCPDPVAFSSEVLIFKCCYANWEIQLLHEIPAIFITPAHLLFENSKPQLLCAFGTRNDGFLLVVPSLQSWLILLNQQGKGWGREALWTEALAFL